MDYHEKKNKLINKWPHTSFNYSASRVNKPIKDFNVCPYSVFIDNIDKAFDDCPLVRVFLVGDFKQQEDNVPMYITVHSEIK